MSRDNELAISAKMKQQLRGLIQAATNAQDGIFVDQSAEFQQLISEINCVASTTIFNENNLLDGKGGNSGTFELQVDAEVGWHILLALTTLICIGLLINGKNAQDAKDTG